MGFKVGFIGFGLIGGSIAKALKNTSDNYNIIVYQYTNSALKEEFKQAINDKVVDRVVFDLDDSFSDCDFIFLCAPILSNIDYLAKLKPIIKPSCIITDVGSVKNNIHQAVISLDMEDFFVGGHPMTGSEKTGYLNSYALLLENAYYIITYTKNTPKDKLNRLFKLVADIGSIGIMLTPSKHDDITAAISHLPHIIAADLVNLIKDYDDTDNHMKELAAGGFRDITRIASSSASIWQNISLTNAESIKKYLDLYINSLKTTSNALDILDETHLYNIFDTAREYRNSIPQKGVGLIRNFFELYLDLTDEAGAIATVATLLAVNYISIKNIGIIHNREFFEGVLRIEFYDKESVEKARCLLKNNHYRVYER